MTAMLATIDLEEITAAVLCAQQDAHREYLERVARLITHARNYADITSRLAAAVRTVDSIPYFATENLWGPDNHHSKTLGDLYRRADAIRKDLEAQKKDLERTLYDEIHNIDTCMAVTEMSSRYWCWDERGDCWPPEIDKATQAILLPFIQTWEM